MFHSKITSNQQGFSLIQVLIVSVLISIIAMFVADLLIQIKKSELKAELNYNMREFDIEVANILLSRKNCDQTIQNALPYLAPTSFPLKVEKIQQKSSNNSIETRFETNKDIFGGKLKISQMSIDKKTPTSTVNSNGINEMILTVTFISNTPTPPHLQSSLTRKIPLTLQFSNGTYTSCSSVSIVDLNSMRQRVCLDVNGSFNPATQTCDIVNSQQVLRTICGAFGASVSGNKCNN